MAAAGLLTPALALGVPAVGSGVGEVLAPGRAANALATAASHNKNFEGDRWKPPYPVSEGFALFAGLFDRIAVVCGGDTCTQQREAWPESVRSKVVLIHSDRINAKLGISDVVDHGYKVTQGHAGAWALLDDAGVDSVFVMEDDYRPMNETVAAFAASASTLAGMAAFVAHDPTWKMLRVGYHWANQSTVCPAECACQASAHSSNICAISLPNQMDKPYCFIESFVSYAVHKRLRPELDAFAHAAFYNYTEHLEKTFDALHEGTRTDGLTGYYSTPVDTWAPATIDPLHYLTPGFIVQQEKPRQLVDMTAFGNTCNHASHGTPLGNTLYTKNVSMLQNEALQNAGWPPAPAVSPPPAPAAAVQAATLVAEPAARVGGAVREERRKEANLRWIDAIFMR